MSNTFIFETTIFIDTIHPYPNPISHYNSTKIMLQKQHNFIPMSTNQAKLKNVMKRNSKLLAYGWPINATTERVLRSYRLSFTWNHTYTYEFTPSLNLSNKKPTIKLVRHHELPNDVLKHASKVVIPPYSNSNTPF